MIRGHVHQRKPKVFDGKKICILMNDYEATVLPTKLCKEKRLVNAMYIIAIEL